MTIEDKQGFSAPKIIQPISHFSFLFIMILQVKDMFFDNKSFIKKIKTIKELRVIRHCIKKSGKNMPVSKQS